MITQSEEEYHIQVIEECLSPLDVDIFNNIINELLRKYFLSKI